MSTIKPRRVDFAAHRDDLKAALMGSLGFSTKFIAESTGLSEGQVNYRLGKAEVRRRDYRDGGSAEARSAVRHMVAGGASVARVRQRLTQDRKLRGVA